MSISELFILEHVFLAHMKKIAAEFWPIQRSEKKNLHGLDVHGGVHRCW